MIQEETYDVVIIGGGPAGLSAAISLLQKQQLSVLVVEGQAAGEERIGESCPPDIILLLKQLGLTKEFYAAQHEACPGYASVWGKADVGYNDFIVNPMGPSWRLNRKAFDTMLAEEAIRLGAKISWSTQFSDANEEEGGHALSLRDRTTNNVYVVKARFVIDASGSTARFAKAIGIDKVIEDRLFASVRMATIASGKTSKQVQIEAVPNGWWYNTLLPNKRIVSMMVSEKEQLPSLREDEHQGFEEQLAQTAFLSKRLEQLELKEHQYDTWPIYSGILPIIEGADWLAIGDAAASYDPVAAHGIYKGMNDGIEASDKIIAFFQGEEDTDSFSDAVRKRYETYKRNRAYVYAIEQRWPETPFWGKRMSSLLERA